MPRFTLIEVDNFPEEEMDVLALPFYLQEGMYRHQKDIDFASEAAVYQAIAGWLAPRPSMTRMIIEYRNIGSGRWQVKGLVAQKYHFGNLAFSIPYRTSLIVSIDPEGRMYSDMLPLPNQMVRWLEAVGRQNPVLTVHIPRAPQIAPIVNVNSAQNTHTASVHQSVTQAIKKLQARYQDRLDEEKSLVELKTMLAKLESKTFPDLTPIVITGAKRSILSLTRIAGETEGSSGLSIKCIVALVWTAINDNERLLVEKEDASKKLIRHLYEIRRDGNLDKHGNDDGKLLDNPICLGGTVNKLVYTLHTIHPDVEIIFADKASASLKFLALVREYAVNFIKHSAEKNLLFEQMKRDKEAGGYPIPESVLEAIKEDVEKVFKEEFKVHISNQDLDNIFSSYKSVSFRENNFNRINLLILCEEQIAVFRTHINKLSEHLKNSDMPQKSKQKIERLNNALTDMLDGLIDVIKQKEEVDKDYYRMFKKHFSRVLNENENELFSSSRFELFRQQILRALNRLIEILSGKKIASISSKTAFFKQKQAMQLSLKQQVEKVINHLPTICNI